jgi:hypothetical protein
MMLELELDGLFFERHVCPLRHLLRLEQGVLELAALAHLEHHAVSELHAIPLVPYRVAEHPDVLAPSRAKNHEDLLRPALKLHERKKMRLVKDPAAHGKNLLERPPDKIINIVPE